MNTKEEMNENWKTYSSRKQRKIRITKQIIKKKTRKLKKWVVTGGKFFIISRIIKWATSYSVFKYKFQGGYRTPALSKVEFIVTGATITMFLVKLVFLLEKFWKIFEKWPLKKNCVLVWAFQFLDTLKPCRHLVRYRRKRMSGGGRWYPNKFIGRNLTVRVINIQRKKCLGKCHKKRKTNIKRKIKSEEGHGDMTIPQQW